MIKDAYSLYQLSRQQFNDLFSENVNNETLDVLYRTVEVGNLDSIDMLHNISLRNDHTGRRAENTLFDLFSGKVKVKNGTDIAIQLAGLILYEIACNNREVNHTNFTKLYFSFQAALHYHKHGYVLSF